MRLKGYHPHKGRAFLEPDVRVAEFVRAAAVCHHMKQDEVLASALLLCFEDEKEGPLKGVYEKLYLALHTGELKRKQFKRPPAVKIENLGAVPAEHVSEDKAPDPVPPEIRAEWDDFIKASL